jgi:hypothetical protein
MTTISRDGAKAVSRARMILERKDTCYFSAQRIVDPLTAEFAKCRKIRILNSLSLNRAGRQGAWTLNRKTNNHTGMTYKSWEDGQGM